MIAEERLSWLDTVTLARGEHSPNPRYACVMEAVAYVAGEPWSDKPKCASQVIGAFLRSWNDALPDDARQMLKPLIPRLVGTNTGPEHEEARAWLATDWLARECAPAFLRLAGLNKHAERLEGLDALTGGREAEIAQPTLDAARDAAREAAAGYAAGAAAWDAAETAAWAAVGAAAAAAAWAAAWAAPRNAARDAARDAAKAAAWDAAEAAAGAAAEDALAPTVRLVQQSALRLVERMSGVGA